MGQPVRTGLDPRELENCSGPQGLGDMRLEKLLSICQPITQQWHATGSFGTLGRKDKRRPGTLEHHSPSFIARIHWPIQTFRRSLWHSVVIASCFDQKNTFSFSQLVSFCYFVIRTPEQPSGLPRHGNFRPGRDSRRAEPIAATTTASPTLLFE